MRSCVKVCCILNPKLSFGSVASEAVRGVDGGGGEVTLADCTVALTVGKVLLTGGKVALANGDVMLAGRQVVSTDGNVAFAEGKVALAAVTITNA